MIARTDVIHTDPEILGGTPVFVGTRVPAQSLFDYLEGVLRWHNRVVAYALLLVTDRYPPFRLSS